MEQHKAFQKLFDIFGLSYGIHSLYEIHDEFNNRHSTLQKKCGSLSISIERIDKGIEDFDRPPLSFQSNKREAIRELEANKRTYEQQLEQVESDMAKLEKTLKEIESLYKCFEPNTYYAFHPELKPIAKVVSPDLFELENTDQVEEYTPEEIDGTGLIMSGPVAPPKKKNYNKFICPHCHNAFASKQKLDQHLRKKKKCYGETSTEAQTVTIQSQEEEAETTKTVFVCCHCNNQYNQQAGLSRHKQTCMKRFKPTTQDALFDDCFELNRFGHEEVHFNRDGIFNRMKSEKYFMGGDINGARQVSRIADKYSRQTLVVGVKTKFFTNPYNYTFYVPNVTDTQAMTYQGANAKEKVKRLHVEDLIEHIVSSVVDALLDAIEDITEFNQIDKYGDEVNTHALYKFLIKYRNNEDVTAKRFVTNEVKRLFADYKDDIKRIWKQVELI